MGTLINQLVWDNNNNNNSNSNSNNNSSSSSNNKKQPAMTTLSNPRFCCEGLTSSQGQLEQKKLQEAERHLNALNWMDQYATLCIYTRVDIIDISFTKELVAFFSCVFLSSLTKPVRTSQKTNFREICQSF